MATILSVLHNYKRQSLTYLKRQIGIKLGFCDNMLQLRYIITLHSKRIWNVTKLYQYKLRFSTNVIKFQLNYVWSHKCYGYEFIMIRFRAKYECNCLKKRFYSLRYIILLIVMHVLVIIPKHFGYIKFDESANKNKTQRIEE